MTRKQHRELEVVKHFIPATCTYLPLTDEDIRRFFYWSDRGIGKDEIEREARQTNTGLTALYWGKQRRDLQVSSYIEDWGTFVDSNRLC